MFPNEYVDDYGLNNGKHGPRKAYRYYVPPEPEERQANSDDHLISHEGRHRLAKAVADALARKGWTVKEAASALGLSAETVIKLKKGDPTLRKSSIRRFAVAFGGSSEYWLALAEQVRPESLLALTGVQHKPDSALNIGHLSPISQTLIRMLSDFLYSDAESKQFLVDEAMCQSSPMRSSLNDGQKVITVTVYGPDYAGLIGDIVNFTAEKGANIMNLSARASVDVFPAVLSMRLVISDSVPDTELQRDLAHRLNEVFRSTGMIVGQQGFVVAASTEELVEDQKPLLGVELALYDTPGALRKVVDVVYGHLWAPIGIEHAVPEGMEVFSNGTLSHGSVAKCMLAIQPMRWDDGFPRMSEASMIVTDMLNLPDVIEARLAVLA